MNVDIEGTRQEQELQGWDIVVGAHFKGTRQGRELRGRDIVIGANFEGARNRVQVPDDGEGRDADDGAAAAAERHHRQFRVTALRLYLIIPKSMTETALCEQFKQFGPSSTSA